MGCCCCCLSGGAEQGPRASEEHRPLSPRVLEASNSLTGLLVDTNLELSVPEAYPPLEAPIPPVVDSQLYRTPYGARGTSGIKNEAVVEISNANSAEAVTSALSLTNLKNLKEIEGKPLSDLEFPLSKDPEVELKKKGETVFLAEEVDDCPICLEEYSDENPKIFTKCAHHYHLACLLEWMERAESCPVCDQEMSINDVISS